MSATKIHVEKTPCALTQWVAILANARKSIPEIRLLNAAVSNIANSTENLIRTYPVDSKLIPFHRNVYTCE